VSASNAPPPAEEVEELIARLRSGFKTEPALVCVEMAAEAVRRAHLDPKQYAQMMELADRHIKAARELDKAARDAEDSEMKALLRQLKRKRDRGDVLVSQVSKLGRPRVVEH
jgi:hypothetical protein